MDDFRKLQKAQIGDGAPKHGRRPYGCSCCNNYPKNKLKKVTRKLAKRRLRSVDRFVTFPKGMDEFHLDA